MNKRSALIFSAGLFLLAVAFFVIFLYNGTGKKEGEITLPQGSAQIAENIDIAKRNNDKVTVAKIDKTNVQAVVASLERPQDYYFSANIKYFYDSQGKDFIGKIWSNGAIQRGQLSDTNGKIEKNVLMTSNYVYIWGEESDVYYRGYKDSITLEDEVRMPTYESISALKSEDITEAETVMLEGRLCIYLQSMHEEGSIVRKWYIDVANGLLIACDTAENGKLIYSMECISLQLGKQDEELFAIPAAGAPVGN